jgi:Protein of unknown function (DUF664)
MPPLNDDERTTLESWLDFHRVTLAMKCEGLDDEQAAVASAPPSGLTLTGIVQHMAEVERNWFRRVLAGEQAPPIYDPRADPDGPDGGFELARPQVEAGTLHPGPGKPSPCSRPLEGGLRSAAPAIRCLLPLRPTVEDHVPGQQVIRQRSWPGVPSSQLRTYLCPAASDNLLLT